MYEYGVLVPLRPRDMHGVLASLKGRRRAPCYRTQAPFRACACRQAALTSVSHVFNADFQTNDILIPPAAWRICKLLAKDKLGKSPYPLPQ